MIIRTANWLVWHVHRAIYLLSRGRLGGGTIRGLQIVMLTTTGRKSGKRRTVPLTSFVDGERWVLIASNAGQSMHPQWYQNLLANSNVALEVRRETFSATARTATPEEKASYWPRITATATNYNGYQARTTRDIPLVILTRVGAAGQG